MFDIFLLLFFVTQSRNASICLQKSHYISNLAHVQGAGIESYKPRGTGLF